MLGSLLITTHNYNSSLLEFFTINWQILSNLVHHYYRIIISINYTIIININKYCKLDPLENP